jgi:hypothetical protein
VGHLLKTIAYGLQQEKISGTEVPRRQRCKKLKNILLFTVFFPKVYEIEELQAIKNKYNSP